MGYVKKEEAKKPSCDIVVKNENGPIEVNESGKPRSFVLVFPHVAKGGMVNRWFHKELDDYAARVKSLAEQLVTELPDLNITVTQGVKFKDTRYKDYHNRIACAPIVISFDSSGDSHPFDSGEGAVTMFTGATKVDSERANDIAERMKTKLESIRRQITLAS